MPISAFFSLAKFWAGIGAYGFDLCGPYDLRLCCINWVLRNMYINLTLGFGNWDDKKCRVFDLMQLIKIEGHFSGILGQL